MAYVYRHIRIDKNIPFYIGLGTDNNYARAKTKTNRNVIWHSIANKTAYTVEILVDELDISIANKKETEFINLYGRIDISTGTLANLTNGGDGKVGCVHSEQTKKMIGFKSKGRVVTEQTRDKIRSSILGTKASPEKLAKMRLRVGEKRTDDFKNKISAVLTGKKLSEQHKNNLSKAMVISHANRLNKHT